MELSIQQPNLLDSSLFWTEALAEDLRIFLTGRVKCPETAADLTQETYLRLYKTSQETPPDNARALAFHIAAQLAIDYHRKSKVRSRYLADVEYDESLELVPNLSAGPEQTAIAQQRLSILHGAIAELSPDCRTAFFLNTIDGLSYSDIAIRMGISKSMVGKHLAKALAHCANRLED